VDGVYQRLKVTRRWGLEQRPTRGKPQVESETFALLPGKVFGIDLIQEFAETL
jgi:hypothetical protein